MESSVRYESLPMLVLRGLVCFPETVIHFDVGRLKSVAALNAAMKKDQRIFLVAQKDLEQEDPQPDEVYTVGVVAGYSRSLSFPTITSALLWKGSTVLR